MEEAQYGTVVTTTLSNNKSSDELSLVTRGGLFPDIATPLLQETNNSSNKNVKDLAEDDILMTTNKDGAIGKGKTVCELFMAWVYGW